jgi:C1A family cysteine protease
MPDHGTGAIQDPPDERDLIVSSATLQQLAGAMIIPASYRVPKPRPPVTDQGMTTQCVAYSSAYEQNYQDHAEWKKFFDFDQNTFYYSIGGNENGAIMRYALDRMVAYGYPEAGGANAAKHKISGYFGVDSTNVTDIKRAIANFGGVLDIMQWFQTWEYPSLENVLPAPGGTVSGHAIWLMGWDDTGHAIAEQSWGKSWGNDGFVRIPWTYITSYAWNIWKTADDLTLAKIAKARIRDLDTRIRNRMVLNRDYQLDARSIFGQAVKGGIRRQIDGQIIESPWYKAFKFKGWHTGARHGIGVHPRGWAELVINGHSRYVARPLVHLVSA